MGEIASSMSTDFGKTWHYHDVILRRPYHLSYPFVYFDVRTNSYVMIPETSRNFSVQLYTCQKDTFPYDFKLVKTLYRGKRFADVSPVYIDGMYWIWLYDITGGRVLRVFSTLDVISSPWIEHPMSPLSREKHFKRPGGRPFLWRGKLYRWAQHDGEHYGEGVHLFHVELNSTYYREVKVLSYIPHQERRSAFPGFSSHRIHHVDAQEIDGRLFALFDGDNKFS